MKRRHLLAALALAACTSRDTKLASIEVPRPDQMLGGNISPHIYEVPAGHADEIRRLFKSQGGAMSYPIAVVSAQGTQTQFVQPQPVFVGDNRFVVAMPEQHHAALEQLLQKMATGPAAAPAGSFEMTYWIVMAAPATEASTAPELGEISGTLDKLSALGKRKFTLIDRLGGRLVDSDESNMRSVRTNIVQTLTGDAQGLQLKLELEENGDPNKDKRGPFIRTSLRLKSDSPVVLGESALSQPVATEDGLLLYVVRARRVD